MEQHRSLPTESPTVWYRRFFLSRKRTVAKHHYVPQFYLKRFGNGKYIPAILLDHAFRFVEKASIRDQSCKPNYYRSSFIERTIGLIEREASRLMRNISHRAPLTEADTIFLKQYIVFQQVRTPAHVQNTTNAMSELLSTAYYASTHTKGPEETDPRIRISNFEPTAWSQISTFCEEILDLEIRYLMSKHEGFITSDQPVAAYNPWAQKGKFAGQGFGCRGLILLLPISSRVAVMLYDQEAYTIRKRDQNSEFITVARDDEKRLNKLQMLGNRSILYLPRPERHQEVQELAREVRSIHGLNSDKIMKSVAKSDDGLSQVIVTERPVIEFGNWTFLYESKEWREVPLEIRGFGIYGSRQSKPEDGPKALRNIRPWNSTRYTDSEGNVSFIHKPTSKFKVR